MAIGLTQRRSYALLHAMRSARMLPEWWKAMSPALTRSRPRPVSEPSGTAYPGRHRARANARAPLLTPGSGERAD